MSGEREGPFGPVPNHCVFCDVTLPGDEPFVHGPDCDIRATDQCDGYLQHWWRIEPPAMGVRYRVTRERWINDNTVRYIDEIELA